MSPEVLRPSGAGPHNVSPTISTKYFVTATDNSAGPNSGCAIIDSVEIFTGATLSAGTVSVSENNFCVSGVPTMSVAGADGGQIQWQRSTISASGPWTNVGTPSTVYAPGTVTQTTHYQVRVSCQSNQVFSNVVTVTVSNPSLSSTNGATRCGPGQVTLTATPNAGTVNWYAAINDINSIATGTSYSPIVTGSTTYYAAATDGGANGSLGLPNRVGSTTNSGYSDIGLVFDAFQVFNLNSVAIYPVATTPSGNVTVTIALKNSSGTVLESTTASVPTSVSPGIKTVVNLNFTVPVGTGHRLVFTAATGGGITGFIRESSTGYVYPYTLPGTASITSAYTSGASSAYYYYFYDWQVSTGCEGTRVAVPVTVTPSTGITASATYLTPCAGNPTDLSVSSTNLDYVYTWSSNPAGFNQTGPGPFTVTPGFNTTYTILANDPNTSCGALATLVVTPTVNNIQSTATASSSSVCPGTDVNLTTTASTMSPYCTATGGTGTYYMNNFSTTGGATNITNNTSGYSPLGYGDFTAMNVTQAVGGSVSWSASAFAVGTMGVAIFVDWNQNGVLTDAGEQMYNSAAYVSSAASSFTVPAGAMNGATRMRVVVDYLNTAPGACDVATSHETEDYSFIVTGGVPNPSAFTYDWSLNPTFLSATNIANPVAQAMTSSQTYTVVVSDLGSGCTKASVVPIIVNPLTTTNSIQ